MYNKNKGFTLLEIMLSVAILMIISIPLLSYFISAVKYNVLAGKKQEAALIAQNVMEDLKNEESLETLVNKYKGLPSWEDKSVAGKSVHYIFSQEKDLRGRTYQINIDLQSEKVAQDANADVKLDTEPDIELLDLANDVIAVEKSLCEESAKLYFLSRNIAACELKEQQGMASVPLTESMLTRGLQRQMYLDFSYITEDGLEYLNTLVVYKYHYSSALGGFADGVSASDFYSYEVLNQRIPLNQSRNVYFFYNPSSNDKVTVSGADFTKINRIYFVSQHSSGTPSLRLEGLGLESEANRQHVYSNAYIQNAPQCQTLVSEKEVVRMLRVTVSIDPYVTLTSMKGE